MEKLFQAAFLATLLSFGVGTATASTTLLNLTLNVSGGTQDYYNAPATPSLHTVSSAAGHIVASIYCANMGTSPVYIHWSNTTTFTIGTTAAINVMPCPTNSTNGAGFIYPIPIGINFAGTAIAYYVSGGGGTTDNTSITANLVYITTVFQ